MAFGALFNPQRAGGARIMPETGASQGSDNPTLREAGAPKLGAAAAGRRDFAAEPLGKRLFTRTSTSRLIASLVHLQVETPAMPAGGLALLVFTLKITCIFAQTNQRKHPKHI